MKNTIKKIIKKITQPNIWFAFMRIVLFAWIITLILWAVNMLH